MPDKLHVHVHLVDQTRLPEPAGWPLLPRAHGQEDPVGGWREVEQETQLCSEAEEWFDSVPGIRGP